MWDLRVNQSTIGYQKKKFSQGKWKIMEKSDIDLYKFFEIYIFFHSFGCFIRK